MHPQATIENSEQGFHVSGDLVFSTVLDLIEKGKEQINHLESDTIHINLSAVKRIDSAGVAILLSWQRDCLGAQKKCQFKSVSQQARSLLETYKLLDILRTQD